MNHTPSMVEGQARPHSVRQAEEVRANSRSAGQSYFGFAVFGIHIPPPQAKKNLTRFAGYDTIGSGISSETESWDDTSGKCVSNTAASVELASNQQEGVCGVPQSQRDQLKIDGQLERKLKIRRRCLSIMEPAARCVDSQTFAPYQLTILINKGQNTLNRAAKGIPVITCTHGSSYINFQRDSERCALIVNSSRITNIELRLNPSRKAFP